MPHRQLLAAALAAFALGALAVPAYAQDEPCVSFVDNLKHYGKDGLKGAIYDTVDAKAIASILRTAPWKVPAGNNGVIADPDSVIAILDVDTGLADIYLSNAAGCIFLRLGPLDRALVEAVIGFADAPPPFSGPLIQRLQGPSI